MRGDGEEEYVVNEDMEREMETQYVLVIDGEEVRFDIRLPIQIFSKGEGGSAPDPGEPFLAATVEGPSGWSGALTNDVRYSTPVEKQLTDEELERLYRDKRQRS